MQNILRYFTVTSAAAFALLASAGCSAFSEPPVEWNGQGVPINYEYLYECLWTMADHSESNEIPEQVADDKGGLFFSENGEIWLMQRKPDLQAYPDKRVYAIENKGKYGLDHETRTLTMSGEEVEGYFRIERLNDRTLTLYYRADPNSYVVYNRCDLLSVIIEM